MKKIFLFILIVFIAASCSIQKRQYCSGYYIQWKNPAADFKKVSEKSSQLILKQIELPKPQEPTIKTELIACKDFIPAKKVNTITSLSISKVEKNIFNPAKKLTEHKKTDFVKVGLSLLLIDIAILLLTLLLSTSSIIGLGIAALILLIIVIVLVLAVVFLIMGIILRVIDNNKKSNPPQQS